MRCNALHMQAEEATRAAKAHPYDPQVDADCDDVQYEADLADHPQHPVNGGRQPPVKVVNNPPATCSTVTSLAV